MKTAQQNGKMVGEFLDAAAAIGITVVGHGLLKKAGVLGKAVEKAPVLERAAEAEKSLTDHLSLGQQAKDSPLMNMAYELEKLGNLEFKPDRTVLRNEHGTFERDLKTGAMLHTAPNGDVYGFPVKGSFQMGADADPKAMHGFEKYFVKHPDGSEVYFDGRGIARRATTQHGVAHQWTFQEDGTISMRSDGGGQHTMDIGPNGKGEAVSWFPKTNPKPGEFNEERVSLPVTYDPITRKAGVYVVPDRTPMSAQTREPIEKARAFLDELTEKKKS